MISKQFYNEKGEEISPITQSSSIFMGGVLV